MHHLAQTEVEQAIMSVVDRLDELVGDLGETGRRAAIANSEYRRKKALMTLAVTEHPPGGVKMDAKSRDARIELACQDEQQAHAFAEAELEILRESLRAHRARLDALRTLAANIRAVTDPRLG
tara:strand:+ start:11831 stop:12199 length:369 start_codon:yes stop_codon:yes gene_type:complete